MLESNFSTIDDNIAVVKMPPTMRKRGRPKGAGLTVIGLPKKKGKTVSTRPTAFVLKSEWEKTRGKVMISITPCFDHLFFSLFSSLSLSLSLSSYAQLVC